MSFEIVQVTPWSMVVRSSGRTATFGAEAFLGGPPHFDLFPDETVHWDPPHEHVLIDDAERARLVKDIVEHYAKQGLVVEVIHAKPRGAH